MEPNKPGTGDGRAEAAKRKGFDPNSLAPHFIAEPLASKLFKAVDGTKPDPSLLHYVIIDLNSSYPGGRDAARLAVIGILNGLSAHSVGEQITYRGSDQQTLPYVFARMSGSAIIKLVNEIQQSKSTSSSGRLQAAPIFRIWEDQEVEGFVTHSISTVKADAAQVAFSAVGRDIVWAVIDSGIDATHRHFKRHRNLLDLPSPLHHRDFRLDASGQLLSSAGPVAADDPSAIIDESGHGTHVAGIIAGAILTDTPPSTVVAAAVAPTNPMPTFPAIDAPAINTVVGGAVGNALNRLARTPSIEPPDTDDWNRDIVAMLRRNDEQNQPSFVRYSPARISGMAPQCKLLSLRVLEENNTGRTSSVLQALEYIQSVNDYGRRIVVHGVNISLGYNFNPEWYACGQSPLCAEVNRLVKSGVCVVVAAGNSGYGFTNTQFTRVWAQGLEMTINDPGNADHAITVGSTHREMPHTYGVSYFSSKGPTGDGRRKPDLLAPGERIISCAAGLQKLQLQKESLESQFEFLEDSGTSMAAPHVSGIIAALLSIRREFIGKPLEVKDILMSTATDLRRDANHQGSGLVDLMRAIQSV